MVAQSADSISDQPSSASNPIMMNGYQEEMCEKLIQLSFVKIVSSKSERGGARLRKNLLILHLLQKARMEQRNRFFASRSLHVTSDRHQQHERDDVPDVNTQRKDDGVGQDAEEDATGGQLEKIDVDVNLSQQCPPPPTRTPVVDVSNVIINDGQTSFNERSPDAGASTPVVQSTSGGGRLLPHCDSSQATDRISGNGNENQCGPDVHTNNTSSVMDVDAAGSSGEEELGTSTNDVKTSAGRTCLKRKHDSTSADSPATKNACMQSSDQIGQSPSRQSRDQIGQSPNRQASDQIGQSPSHQSADHIGNSPTRQSRDHIGHSPSHHQHQTGSANSFNHLLTVLKSASLTSTTPSEGSEGQTDASAVSSLSRSLSCSSFMELTCES